MLQRVVNGLEQQAFRCESFEQVRQEYKDDSAGPGGGEEGGANL